MAKTVASLSISINARTKGLRKGLKRARAQVADFAKAITGAIGRVAKLGAGLGLLAAGVTAIGTGKAISSLDNLAKTARKLSIKPTALVALRDAAKESGVEIKTFDMGLQRMLRRVQEAAKGKGEALPTLKELGLDASRLARLKPEEQFVAVAKAMDKMKDDGQDLARAMKLFDSEGVALVNTLRLVNEKGLKPFLEQVKQTGRGGPLLEERLGNVESVVDAFGRLKDRVVGIFQQMAVSVAVPLDTLLGRFENFLSSGGVQKRMIQFFLNIRNAGFAASRFIHDFFNNTGKAAEFRQQLTKLFDRFKEFVAWVTEHLTAENMKKAFDAIVDSVKSAIKAIQDLIKLYQKLRDFIPGVHREAVSQQSENMLKGANAIGKARAIFQGTTGLSEKDIFRSLRDSAAARGDPGKLKLGSDEEKKQTKILEEIKQQGAMKRGSSGQLVLITG